MLPTEDQLDVIYEVLADTLHNNEIVSSYLQNNRASTKFVYIGKIQALQLAYYLPGENRLVKVVDLSDVSCEKDFLEEVLKDAAELVKKAREEKQVLDFYLTKIKNL